MPPQDIRETKKMGRPPGRTKPETALVRIQVETLADLDTWISEQPEPRPSRPEAMRTIMSEWMSANGRKTAPQPTTETKIGDLHRLWDQLVGTVEQIPSIDVVKVEWGLEARRAGEWAGAVSFTAGQSTFLPPDPVQLTPPDPVMRLDLERWLKRIQNR